MMKKLLCLVACVLPLFVSAKELPPQEDIMARLDQSGMTKSNQWKSIGNGFQQDVKGGILFVSAGSVSSMMTISNNEDEIQDSFAYAGMHCAASSIISIDMQQNKTLLNNMLLSFSDTLKSYQNKNTTMVWGYNFDTELIKTEKGIIANCTLK